MEEGDGLRTRSFRNEDYNTRRAFLRSYPLNFDNDELDQEPQVHATTTWSNKVGASEFDHIVDDEKERKSMKMKKTQESMKRIMVTIIEWGGRRIVVIRRFKHKVSIYVVACFSTIVFKSPKALTSKP